MRRAWQVAAATARQHRTTILVTLLAAAWLLPGIWWGLPVDTPAIRMRAWGPDELGPMGSLNLLDAVTGGPNLLSPQYPLAHYFVQAVLVWPYYFAVLAADNLGFGQLQLSSPVLMLLHRVPSLLLAAGCVAAGRAAALRMSAVPAAGWVAAAAIATAGPLVYYARTSNVDAPSLFWVALALAGTAVALRHGLSVRGALLLGLWAGLGTATKDQNYAVFAALGLALAGTHAADARRQGWPARWWLAPAAGLGSALVAYVATSGTMLLPEWFRGHVDFILHGSRGAPERFRHLIGFYYSNPPTLAGYARVTGNAASQLVAAIGLPVLLLAIAGLLHAARRDRRLLLLALPIPVLFLGVILPVRFVLPRFLLPVGLILCLFAGLGVASFDTARPAWRRGVRLLALAGIAWNGLRALDLTYQMLNDGRRQAAEWLATSLQPGDTVGYYGARIKLPALPAGTPIVPAPFQYQVGEEAPPDSRPPFIISVPQQITEPVHEWIVPDSMFARLLDGSLGYRLVLAVQTRSLWTRPLLVSSFVNPPVRVFVRDDIADRRALAPRLELSGPDGPPRSPDREE